MSTVRNIGCLLLRKRAQAPRGALWEKVHIRAGRSLLADAVQVLVRPQEQLPVAHRRRGVEHARVVGKRVVRQLLERRLRRQDVRPLGAADRVDLAVGDGDRGVQRPAALQALAVGLLAVLDADAVDRAAVVGPEQVVAVQGRRADRAAAHVRRPHLVGLRHVALAPRLDGQARPLEPAAQRVDDAVLRHHCWGHVAVADPATVP